MKRRSFIGLGLGLLVGGGVVRRALETTDTDRLLAQVNRRRTARDLRALRTDVRLNHTAQVHAEWMAAHGLLEHSHLKLPYGDDWVGEIIGVGGDFRSVMDAWIASDEHRRILLERRARFVGGGTAFDGERWWLVVQFAH